MKTYKPSAFVLCIIALSLLACGHEHNHKHDHEHSHEYEHEDHETQVKLSEAAIENYGIRTRKVLSGSPITLPRTAVVAFKDEYFIYIKSYDEFREIEASPTMINKDSVTLGAVNLHKDEEIVVSGAAYLRIIFLNHRNPSDHGHFH